MNEFATAVIKHRRFLEFACGPFIIGCAYPALSTG